MPKASKPRTDEARAIDEGKASSWKAPTPEREHDRREWQEAQARVARFAEHFKGQKSEPDTPAKLLADLDERTGYKSILQMLAGRSAVNEGVIAKQVHELYQRAHRLDAAGDAPAYPDSNVLTVMQARAAVDELRKWCVRQQRPADANGKAVSIANPIAQAVVMKSVNPRLSVRKAAEAVGIPYLQLQRSPLWQQARERLKQVGKGNIHEQDE